MSASRVDSVEPGAGVRTIRPYTKVQNIALLVLRLVVAGIFLYAGSAKWPFWSAPPEGMSVLLLNVMKLLSVVEPLGSLALLLGLLTRWVAAGLSIIMVGAIFYSRLMLHAGLFTTPQGTGLDYNLLILAGCIALVAFGAGSWSLDAIRRGAWHGRRV
jgi:putative oxidoreductase